MSYLDIFIMGWNLNAMMFVINFLIVLKVVSSKKQEDFKEESIVLRDLKQEFEHYYPYRKYVTLLTYILPFTAFFRMSYRLFEMYMFFGKNSGTTMYDYMTYKYQSDINLAKQRSNTH